MASTVVLITGANRGIGLAFARLYSKRPNHVVIGACRNATDTDATHDLRKEGCLVVTLDVGSDDSCNTLPSQLAELQIEKVDVVINNAGIGMFDDLNSPSLTQDALSQYNVNALGPLRVTTVLLPFLKRSAQPKVINLSSKMGSCSSNLSGRYYGYRASKAAENIISVSLARDLSKDNVICLLINPGLIKTRMNDNGDMGADEAVGMMIEIVDRGKLEDGDKFFNRDGKLIEW
jgi:NAD(P)-dependent dehydrogenase (short-subunit alcohol dehydrogenase family)